LHGGKAGAPKGNKNNLKHGFYTAKAIAHRRKVGMLLRAARKLTRGVGPADDCHTHDGTNTVEQCIDGSFTVTDPRGDKRVYGTPNAGFERYPGEPQPPVYERRDRE
jgi:hypothetical protein